MSNFLKKTNLRQCIGISLGILCLCLGIRLFFIPAKSYPEVLIVSLIIIGVGTPILYFENFSEANIFGFKLSLKQKVDEIGKNLLLNQSVTIISSSMGERQWFWVDQRGFAFIITKLTSDFLSKGDGAKQIKELEKDLIHGTLPAWETTAEVLFNGNDIFIKFNGKLYYQNGLAWVYKLAALKNIQISGSDFRKWTHTDYSGWAKQITDEFLTLEVA